MASNSFHAFKKVLTLQHSDKHQFIFFPCPPPIPFGTGLFQTPLVTYPTVPCFLGSLLLRSLVSWFHCSSGSTFLRSFTSPRYLSNHAFVFPFCFNQGFSGAMNVYESLKGVNVNDLRRLLESAPASAASVAN